MKLAPEQTLRTGSFSEYNLLAFSLDTDYTKVSVVFTRPASKISKYNIELRIHIAIH
jgi:hypothetical protein